MPITENEFWEIAKSFGRIVKQESSGIVTIEYVSESGRKQLVTMSVLKLSNKLGFCAQFVCLICERDKMSFERALGLNASMVKFGAIGLSNDMLVIRETLQLATCSKEEIETRLTEMVMIADILEKEVYGKNMF